MSNCSATAPPTKLRAIVVAVAITVLQVLSYGGPTEAANVLAAQTTTSKSHWNVLSAVLRALTDRGHNVTVFTPYSDGGGHSRHNYTEVDVSDDTMIKMGLDASFVIEKFGTTAAMMTTMVNVNRRGCNTVFGHGRMTDILQRKGDSGFDVLFVEPLFSDCVAHLASELDIPTIYIIAPPVITYMERSLIGHFPNPAVVPHVLSAHSTLKTFAERFANVLHTVYCASLKWYADVRPPAVKPSVVFANSHFITDPSSRPLPPNVVQIGGIHLRPPESIPEDILQFIDDSPHGVIYFTFGSVLSQASLPEKVQKVFRQALARVPQRVLWKYEGEMVNKSENVMTKHWFPQHDILLHPKVRLFISHGGVSGVYEAVDAGVPVLGFPIFYDQPRNIANLVDAGMAISMDLMSVTEQTLLDAVSELVNNENYRENAKIASELFKDRPMSPAESVVYWTEYVLRHNGAPHLKSHAHDLTWYQYFLIDVIAALALTAFVVSFITYSAMKNAYEYCVHKPLRKTKAKRD